VAILGTGREGRAAWRWLRARFPGMALTLIDEKTPAEEFTALLGAADRLEIGPLEQARLERFALLIRSPGISLYREPLQQALAAGSRSTTASSLWFAAHPDARSVCVTGTKGKSTTSALIAHVLEKTGSRVCLAGNIGRPLLDCEDRDVDWWVIELSSYQLADLAGKPSLAVLLNLTPEHLDWHGGEARYRQDKLRLADLANGNPIVANAADPLLREALAGRGSVHWFNGPAGFHVRSGRLWFGDSVLDPVLPAGLPGAHNLANLAAVLTVTALAGVEFETALSTLPGFRPLPHRLQLLGERDGLRFINDSISSTPVATAAALQSLAGQEVTLIVGGLDRGLDWTPYMRTFAELTPRAVIGLPDSGPRIVAALQDAGIRPVAGLHQAAGLADAVTLACRLAVRPGTVLLSPGAPSFPRFVDYRDRGRQFARLCGLDFVETDPF